MRTVSTGAGLCVLGACVLCAAALSSPRLGGAASAAQSRPQLSMTLRELRKGQALEELKSFAPPTNPGATKRNTRLSGACADLEPDIWFTIPHRIDLCIDGSRLFGFSDERACDINGDGNLEYLSQDRSLYTISSTTSADSAILLVDAIQGAREATTLQYRPVMTAAPLLALIASLQNLESGTEVMTNFNGLRDMDADGDIDAIFWFGWNDANGVFQTQFAWIENTGLQRTPRPNPYDHDGDGSVNTADLSLLLLNFD